LIRIWSEKSKEENLKKDSNDNITSSSTVREIWEIGSDIEKIKKN